MAWSPSEPAPLTHLLNRLRHYAREIAPHPNVVEVQQRTAGERISDSIAAMAGSWTFILLFLAVLTLWIGVNLVWGSEAFDPYPFIFLNLVLSTVAALQAPVIMMSQNRQVARDRLYADLDYRVNVRAELELVQMRAELEELRRAQWDALVAMQGEQLELLKQLCEPR